MLVALPKVAVTAVPVPLNDVFFFCFVIKVFYFSSFFFVNFLSYLFK